jgi:hypothetical protein
MEVIPSFLGGEHFDGNMFGNLRLRPGEVQAIYGKNHPKNVSKKFNEYQVFVEERVNNTAVSRMYEHVVAVDLFGGVADTFTKTYRADPSARRKHTPHKPSVGSKVLLMCVNGETHNAYIVGGLRDSAGPDDDPELGHHLHFRFNGIDVSINKDGELTLQYQGAMNADGSTAEGVDEKALGTTIKLTKDGNVKIADAVTDGDEVKEKNVIFLDHVNSKLQLTADVQVDVIAPKITRGAPDATEPDLLGNKWKAGMEALFDAIAQLTVPTAMGPSGTPINTPAFQQLRAKLSEQLSKIAFTKE